MWTGSGQDHRRAVHGAAEQRLQKPADPRREALPTCDPRPCWRGGGCASRCDGPGAAPHCAPLPAAASRREARSHPPRPLPAVPGGEAVSAGATRIEQGTVACPGAGPAVGVPSLACPTSRYAQPARRPDRPTNLTNWPTFHHRLVAVAGPRPDRPGPEGSTKWPSQRPHWPANNGQAPPIPSASQSMRQLGSAAVGVRVLPVEARAPPMAATYPKIPSALIRTLGTPRVMGAAGARVAGPLPPAWLGEEGGETPSPPRRYCSKGGWSGGNRSPAADRARIGESPCSKFRGGRVCRTPH